jgi:hypothetical protein
MLSEIARHRKKNTARFRHRWTPTSEVMEESGEWGNCKGQGAAQKEEMLVKRYGVSASLKELVLVVYTQQSHQT